MFLEVRHAKKSFNGLNAVDDISLVLDRGEIVSIIGPNGAGKTTLLNLISGALSLSSGEILFSGRNIENIPAHEICEIGIARSFQNLQLFNNMSVIDNVMIGRQLRMKSSLLDVILRREKVREEEKGAFDFAMKVLVMLDLDGKAYQKPDSLALRDRMFVGIARALSTEPKLLLLDEPVGGLTVKEIDETSRKIMKLNESGITILFIEHRMELVKGISDRVIVMNFGRKISEGTFDEIQTDKQVLSAYLGRKR